MRTAIGLSALILAGCTVMGPPAPSYFPPVSVAFSPSDIAWFKEPGRNAIMGAAVLRTVGGEPRTCAGLEVTLIPSSPYAVARFETMYGERESGYLPADHGKSWEVTDPDYAASGSRARCDAQGNFAFTNIPDGTYYVTAPVVWGIPQQYHTSTEGGILMQKVSVAGGETKRVVLTGS